MTPLRCLVVMAAALGGAAAPAMPKAPASMSPSLAADAACGSESVVIAVTALAGLAAPRAPSRRP